MLATAAYLIVRWTSWKLPTNHTSLSSILILSSHLRIVFFRVVYFRIYRQNCARIYNFPHTCYMQRSSPPPSFTYSTISRIVQKIKSFNVWPPPHHLVQDQLMSSHNLTLILIKIQCHNSRPFASGKFLYCHRILFLVMVWKIIRIMTSRCYINSDKSHLNQITVQ